MERAGIRQLRYRHRARLSLQRETEGRISRRHVPTLPKPRLEGGLSAEICGQRLAVHRPAPPPRTSTGALLLGTLADMGGRKRGTHPYDYTVGDDGRFLDSGHGGTLRVLHGPGRGMGDPEGVTCHVEVISADGAVLDESREGKWGKEHRLHGTAPGDR